MKRVRRFLKKCKKKNNEGQSIIEFVIFAPFMLIFFALIVTVANAINNSINQQKITRAYLYQDILNDSYYPQKYIKEILMVNGSIQGMGLFAFLWGQDAENEKPIASCQKLVSLSSEVRDEKCSPGVKENKPTQFIRIKTAYGPCTGNFVKSNGNLYYRASAAASSCTNY